MRAGRNKGVRHIPLRAFQESEQAGVFAALAMGLNGLMTALLLPVVMSWVMG